MTRWHAGYSRLARPIPYRQKGSRNRRFAGRVTLSASESGAAGAAGLLYPVTITVPIILSGWTWQ
jgi:hypothetical protein